MDPVVGSQTSTLPASQRRPPARLASQADLIKSCVWLMTCAFAARFDRPIVPSLASPALSRLRRSLHRYFLSSTRLSTLVEVRLCLASSTCGNVVLDNLDSLQPASFSPPSLLHRQPGPVSSSSDPIPLR
ncbi:hypothetical protein FJTKL_02808 [Diaporthe vaccinii]|uniref:Uncharacterized protein n=1 Tax=Diaporthe vaccinii TaxID=105482 RepID=A0ABR4F2L1_9PEZI